MYYHHRAGVSHQPAPIPPPRSSSRPRGRVGRDMKTTIEVLLLSFALMAALVASVAAAAPPDYKVWGELLSKYYDPAKGMNYKALKANDKKAMDDLRHQMATVDV